MPVIVLKALVVNSLCWDWPDLAIALLCGFLGMLRPHELLGLRAEHGRFVTLQALSGLKVFFLDLQVGDSQEAARSQ